MTDDELYSLLPNFGEDVQRIRVFDPELGPGTLKLTPLHLVQRGLRGTALRQGRVKLYPDTGGEGIILAFISAAEGTVIPNEELDPDKLRNELDPREPQAIARLILEGGGWDDDPFEI